MALSQVESARDLVIARAHRQLAQTRLVVDYYRIRRRLAYSLPVRQEKSPVFPTRLEGRYPWESWLAWAVEERIFCLGWAGTWLKNQLMLDAVQRDLLGLAAWRYDTPLNGLAVGHFVRTMVQAVFHWPGLASTTQSQITAGLNHLMEHYQDWLDSQRSWWERRQRQPDHPDFAAALHNIHFIESAGLCLAARFLGHDRADGLERQMTAFCLALLDQHQNGLSEGVSYDGYILDFMAGWLAGAPAEWRQRVLDHPELEAMLQQSAVLAAPGNLSAVAKLGDVEPVQMPFHISALAKFRRLRPDDRLDALLARYDLSALRTDALAALIEGPALDCDARPPAAQATRAARVLRSGWEMDDLAVAASVHGGAMGHLHHDNGSVVIAAGGHWMIDDPGYQQYLPTSEREFTVGPAAHNAPLLNGRRQSARAGVMIQEPAWENQVGRLVIDLKGCYDLPLEFCRRHLWLVDRRLIVIADQIRCAELHTVAYHWHGHPDASWWAQEGMALIYLNQASLWIRCFQDPLEQNQIDRLRGSRGHLTLSASFEANGDHLFWWAFATDRDLLGRLSLQGDRLTANDEPWCLQIQ